MSLLPQGPHRAGLGRRHWPRQGHFGHLNGQNIGQNGRETPLAWPKGPRRGQGDAGVAKGTSAWPKMHMALAGRSRWMRIGARGRPIGSGTCPAGCGRCWRGDSHVSAPRAPAGAVLGRENRRGYANGPETRDLAVARGESTAGHSQLPAILRPNVLKGGQLKLAEGSMVARVTKAAEDLRSAGHTLGSSGVT